MGGLGWGNAFPLELGGGPTEIEQIYDALRAAVGTGGPGPVDGIEDLWRQCKARTIAAATTSMERAALQALPLHATDHLPVYERLLGITPQAGATEAERQDAVTAVWVRQLRADGPGLRLAVRAIDARADLDLFPYADAVVVQMGKAFGPRPSTGSYGEANASGFPNYASDFIQIVTYTLDPTQTEPDPVTFLAIQRLLGEVLPSWVFWECNDGYGFFFDGGDDGLSILDIRAFG